MTTTNPIDAGFAPWSLMTPDPGVSKRGTTPTVQEARLYHRDEETHRAKADDGYMFGEEGFSFGDFLDVVNPLHHLPVVGAIYRSLTGDEIDPGAKVAGGTLYGGPIGLAAGVVNAMIEEHSGDDLGGHAMAFLFGEGEGGEATASDTAPVDVAALPDADFVNANPNFAAMTNLYPANAGAVTARQMPAARYGGAGDAAPDMASAMFMANGNSAAAANVAAFNQTAFRRSDVNGTEQAGATQAASQPAASTGGTTRISQRMADHLAKLAGQDLAPALAETAAQQAGIPQAVPQSISGPLPQAFSDDAPVGNPFAAAAEPTPLAVQTAALSVPTASVSEPVRADRLQAAISQSGTAAVGYENPNDIARAMMTAIERYEQQRAN